jgi:hypothetical protein
MSKDIEPRHFFEPPALPLPVAVPDVTLVSKLLKSIVLILASIGALTIGLQMAIAMWIVVFGLFSISRFSKGVWFFTEWSWLQFLLTIVCAVGIPYVALLLTFEF